MEHLEVLKIRIYQPQAHYRVPFTYQRRHTYPIPPYSTVIGFLCNILGIRNYKERGEPCEKENCDCDYHRLKRIKISICGKFATKTTEYVWFRNLSKESHNQRFSNSKVRCISGHIEHIGGQVPVLIDVLNDVTLWIYLYHKNKNFLDKLLDKFKESERKQISRIYPLHLGRAEDWIVIENIKFVKVEIRKGVYNFDVFVWIPERNHFPESFHFEEIGGLLYKIPTFYNKYNGVRNFIYEKVKLNDGVIGNVKFCCDNEENKPVFLLKNIE